AISFSRSNHPDDPALIRILPKWRARTAAQRGVRAPARCSDASALSTPVRDQPAPLRHDVVRNQAVGHQALCGTSCGHLALCAIKLSGACARTYKRSISPARVRVGASGYDYPGRGIDYPMPEYVEACSSVPPIMEIITNLELLDDPAAPVDLDDPRTSAEEAPGRRMVYIETYGCQMNVSDSEIVASVLR